MTVDGRGEVVLTPSRMSDDHPAWSPVAARIAFTRYNASAGSRGVFVANADGGDVRACVRRMGSVVVG